MKQKKNYDAAIKLIDEMILKNHQEASSLLFRKAEALIELKEYKKAITTLEIYVRDCSIKEKLKSYVLIATCYASLNDEKKTEEYLEKVIELDPENDLVLKQLSYRAYINHEFKKCCEYIKRLIKLEKADIEDYINLIFCCIELGMIDDALKYAEKVISIDPTNLDVFATLTILYDDLEDEEKLNEVCERIINLKDDGTLQIMLLKAQASLELGKKDEAFSIVNKAIKLNPYDPFPYLMKGMLLNKLEMFDEANECFSEAFSLNPEILLAIERLSN